MELLQMYEDGALLAQEANWSLIAHIVSYLDSNNLLSSQAANILAGCLLPLGTETL